MLEPYIGFAVGMMSGFAFARFGIGKRKRGRPRKSMGMPFQQLVQRPAKKLKPIIRDDEAAWRVENKTIDADPVR